MTTVDECYILSLSLSLSLSVCVSLSLSLLFVSPLALSSRLMYSHGAEYSQRRKVKLFTTSWYFACFKKCGVRMVLKPTLTNFLRRPGGHNHENEIENINVRIQSVTKDPTQTMRDLYDNALE